MLKPIGLSIGLLSFALLAGALPSLAEDSSHEPAVKPLVPAQPKAASPNLHPRPAVTVSAGAGSPVARNAVGMPVGPKTPVAKPVPAHDGLPRQAVGTAALSGKISGTGMSRPAGAPSPLGGPAKPSPALNGTAIRPKH
jgi:hypothetical protein